MRERREGLGGLLKEHDLPLPGVAGPGVGVALDCAVHSQCVHPTETDGVQEDLALTHALTQQLAVALAVGEEAGKEGMCIAAPLYNIMTLCEAVIM